MPWNKNEQLRTNHVLLFLLAGVFLLGSCKPAVVDIGIPIEESWEEHPLGLTESETLTLSSLKQVDDYPLYTMVYHGEYSRFGGVLDIEGMSQEKPSWACSLFAAFGDPEDMLLGRNFDWDFSPGLLLFTDPPDGLASVSVIDLYYLGYEGDRAFGITDLPQEEQVELLSAPALPFDGMNEAGLIVAMAAVPDGRMVFEPEKETVDSVMVIRMILDRAETIEQAVEIIRSVNIDMQGNYLHYLIAEGSGRSVLVEFYKGEIVVRDNTDDWQVATNFLLSAAGDTPHSQCWRYDLINSELKEMEGIAGVHVMAIEWEEKLNEIIGGAGLLPRPVVEQ
jgi:hypothetical protein